ncbi:MAG: hypothetical protein K8T91_08035 [Planctomycetes bacterium]|nr:hypothetical protein [Planctomycetota bacterium]
MSKIALLSMVLVLGLSGVGLAGGLMSADEGVNSFLDQPTVSYPSDHGYQRVNWFVGYDPIYGSCSQNIWDGYCPKKCHNGRGKRCGAKASCGQGACGQ